MERGEGGCQYAVFVYRKGSKIYLPEVAWRSLLAAKFGLKPQLRAGRHWAAVCCVFFFDRLNWPCDSFLSLFPPSSPQTVLCFSAAGATLRGPARKFPAVVNCTAIDWFGERQREARRAGSGRMVEGSRGGQGTEFQARQSSKKAAETIERLITE